MRYIFFDTETTGLPKEYDAPITDIDNWPRLVQLAWIIHDNNVVARKNYIIKPLGFTIPNISTKIHGISTEQALERGQKIESVLNNFLEDTKDADVIIGHNIQFDLKIVQSELYRLNIKNNLDQIAVLDTMMLSVNYCKIPNKQHGYRYPKLIELYNKLFSVSFENMHDAMADIEATAKCFWALIDRGIIDKKNYPCLLTLSDRQSLAEKYNMQAFDVECKKQRDCDRKAEDLYHKSAELGNTKGMLEVARYAYLRNDNNTALYWLKEIVRLSKRQKVSEYEEALKRLVRIYNNTSNSLMAKKYQQLLDSEINNKAKAILANYQKSESDFYKLVLLLKEGMNGSYKDKERAIELMKEGIEKGYRSLFRMYSDYLRNQGDDRYLFYLLEDIKDTEKDLSEEFSFMESSYNKDVAISTYRKHKDYWLTERYRLVAEAFIKGFGIKDDHRDGSTDHFSAKALVK